MFSLARKVAMALGNPDAFTIEVGSLTVTELAAQIGLSRKEILKALSAGSIAKIIWSWRSEGHRVQRLSGSDEEADQLNYEISRLDDIVWERRDEAYITEDALAYANQDAADELYQVLALLAFCMCLRDGHWPSWWRTSDQPPDRMLCQMG